MKAQTYNAYRVIPYIAHYKQLIKPAIPDINMKEVRHASCTRQVIAVRLFVLFTCVVCFNLAC